MATENITGIVKHQIRTTSSWTSVNPILLLGEIGIDSDLNIIKVGDGSLTWSALDAMGYCGVDDSLSYRGLRDKANGTSDWIRTTLNGIIPYATGVNSSLGTSSWGFSNIYGEDIYDSNVLLEDKYFAIAGGAVLGSIKASKTGANFASIYLNVENAGSPQIEMADNSVAGGDAGWSVGVDDGDNSFKIHGGATSTCPIINNLVTPFFEITTAGAVILSNTLTSTGDIRTNSDFKLGANANISFNTTDDSIDFIIN